jgi:hypothetical protein
MNSVVMLRGVGAVRDAVQRRPYIPEWLRWLLTGLVEAPLLYLYLNGPDLGGVGGWRGTAPEEICAQLTSVHTLHWQNNIDACYSLVFQRFDSNLTLVYTVMYILLSWRLAIALVLLVKSCAGRGLRARVPNQLRLKRPPSYLDDTD